MTRNYEIAEFRETDDLSPTTTRKLNTNFRNVLQVLRDMSIEGADTTVIASYVISQITDDLDDVLAAAEAYTDAAIANLEPGSGGGGGGEGGDCTCGAYTVVPWTGSSYDEDRHYDDDTQSYVAVHKVSGYKTWEELGFEPMSLATDISGIINGTAPSAPAYSGTVPDLPDDEMCCGGTCVIKVPWTDSPYDENKYYDEDLEMDVALHTLDGFKTFEELGLEPYDYETLIDSLF